METVIGFVAGYLVGVADGKEGLERLRSSWESIRKSAEVRKMAGEAATVVRTVVRQLPEKALGRDATELADELARSAVTALTRKGSQAA
jgi:hypothetical protein